MGLSKKPVPVRIERKVDAESPDPNFMKGLRVCPMNSLKKWSTIVESKSDCNIDSALFRFSCLDPRSRDGMAKIGASRTPELELPTMNLDFFSELK